MGLVVEYPEARVARLYEEHAVVELHDADGRPEVGEVVTIIPNHACGVVNLHDQMEVHRGGVSQGTWAIDAPGEKPVKPDLVIRNGTVFDGTGAEGVVGRGRRRRLRHRLRRSTPRAALPRSTRQACSSLQVSLTCTATPTTPSSSTRERSARCTRVSLSR